MGDFNLLKFEDPKALGKTAISFMDKIEHACGWLVIPKGKRKDFEEAVNYLIPEIEKDPSMSPYLKAYKIANVRKDIKEYGNKNSIACMAAEQLGDKAQPEKIDDDWLLFFFDRAKNVSQDDTKIIWSKLLANECEQPNSVSRSLINVLAYLDTKDAIAYNTLCNHTLIAKDGDDTPVPFVDLEAQEEYYKKIGLTFSELNDLESAGLIKFDADLAYSIDKSECSFVYFNTVLTAQDEKHRNIAVGNVILTSTGMALRKVIQPEYSAEVIPLFKEFLIKRECSIDIKTV